jgi:hypothetical protein
MQTYVRRHKVGTMATAKRVVRKNGIPVKKFWSEKLNARGRESFTTTYPVYFTSVHSPDPADFDKVWSLTGEKAPRSLEDAVHTARVLIESSETPQTTATIYELRAVHRVGTEFDWKLHETNQRMQRARSEAASQTQDRARFTLVATTASEGVTP